MDHYYVIPGGTVEPDETPERTAARELKEELGTDVHVGALVAIVHFRGTVQYYFASTATGGRFGSGMGAELLGTDSDPCGTYTPVWVPLERLHALPVRPHQIAGIVVQAASRGWPEAPVEIRDDGSLPPPRAPR